MVPQLGENQSLKKADEWRRILTVTPIIIWWAWKDDNDDIPLGEPIIPPNAKSVPEHSRNYRAIYSAVLKLCAGVRILGSRTISMAQARVGQDFILQYCRDLKNLRIHTTINHHLARHYLKFIKLFGPVYGWWLFAFERFNGMLEKVKHNGHDGGRMELTLMRSWVMTHLIFEYLLALPEDGNDLEKGYIDRIIRTEARENRGGMMSDLAVYRAEASLGNNVSLPRRLGKTCNIADLLPNGRSYALMLKYAQDLWPDLNIIDDHSMEDGLPFYRSQTCRPLTYIRKDGIRYGATSNKRTKVDSLAFISDGPGHRAPAEILSLVSVKVDEKPPHVCALVHRMQRDEDIPVFPWDL